MTARPAWSRPKTTAFLTRDRLLERALEPLGHQVARELALGQVARVPAHPLDARRIPGQRAQRPGERLGVPGGNPGARVVLLDEPPHPAVEVDDRRLARRQRVEELVRRVRLQHRVGREDRQRDVGGADDSRELLLRHRRQEAEVVEPELPRPLLEARPLAAVAERDDRRPARRPGAAAPRPRRRAGRGRSPGPSRRRRARRTCPRARVARGTPRRRRPAGTRPDRPRSG